MSRCPGSRLRTATPDDPNKDIQQIFGILVQFEAQSGKGAAVVREFVLEAERIALAQAVAPDLIRLQGICGFLACVRRFGPVEHWWLIREMTHALEERDGTEPGQSALREARQANAEFDRRLRLVEEKDNALASRKLSRAMTRYRPRLEHARLELTRL